MKVDEHSKVSQGVEARQPGLALGLRFETNLLHSSPPTTHNTSDGFFFDEAESVHSCRFACFTARFAVFTMSPLQEPGRRKRVRVELFEESGMTEDDRRQVRHLQRNLHDKIEKGPGDDNEVSKMKFLSKARGENNQLFDSVRFTREAVLDSENATLIVEKTLLEVDKLRQVSTISCERHILSITPNCTANDEYLAVKVERFDAEKLVRALRSKLSTEGTEERHFNWTLLGRECGICFNAAPSGVRFLAGSVDMEGEKVVRKARAKRQVNKQEEAAEVRPEVMDKESSKGDADTLSAAEKVMKDLDKLLKKRSKQEMEKKFEEHADADEDTQRKLKEHATEVDGVKFLINPNSFTQSVENMFNFSFLVKKGKAGIGVRSPMERDDICQEGLWVQHHHSNDGDQPEPTQAVISFTMKDWRRIKQAHQLKQGDIPHRTGSRHARAAASQQE